MIKEKRRILWNNKKKSLGKREAYANDGDEKNKSPGKEVSIRSVKLPSLNSARNIEELK